MRFLFIVLFISGCSQSAYYKSSTSALKATCYMNNFKKFPKKITGIVTLDLKNYLTIMIKNEDKTESVEMTFSKTKCKVM